MKVKLTQTHPSGILKGAGVEVSDSLGAKLIDQGYAKEVQDKEFAELPTNNELGTALKDGIRVKAQEETKAASAKVMPCVECGGDPECEDCLEAAGDTKEELTSESEELTKKDSAE